MPARSIFLASLLTILCAGVIATTRTGIDSMQVAIVELETPREYGIMFTDTPADVLPLRAASDSDGLGWYDDTFVFMWRNQTESVFHQYRLQALNNPLRRQVDQPVSPFWRIAPSRERIVLGTTRSQVTVYNVLSGAQFSTNGSTTTNRTPWLHDAVMLTLLDTTGRVSLDVVDERGRRNIAHYETANIGLFENEQGGWLLYPRGNPTMEPLPLLYLAPGTDRFEPLGTVPGFSIIQNEGPPLRLLVGEAIDANGQPINPTLYHVDPVPPFAVQAVPHTTGITATDYVFGRDGNWRAWVDDAGRLWSLAPDSHQPTLLCDCDVATVDVRTAWDDIGFSANASGQRHYWGVHLDGSNLRRFETLGYGELNPPLFEREGLLLWRDESNFVFIQHGFQRSYRLGHYNTVYDPARGYAVVDEHEQPAILDPATGQLQRIPLDGPLQGATFSTVAWTETGLYGSYRTATNQRAVIVDPRTGTYRRTFFSLDHPSRDPGLGPTLRRQPLHSAALIGGSCLVLLASGLWTLRHTPKAG